jgi:hypothetical protein
VLIRSPAEVSEPVADEGEGEGQPISRLAPLLPALDDDLNFDDQNQRWPGQEIPMFGHGSLPLLDGGQAYPARRFSFWYGSDFGPPLRWL